MNSIRVFQAAAAVCIALEVCSFSVEARSQTQFNSGIYEGLMLAVDAKGFVTGYYRDTQGSGVTKTCSFFLYGRERYGRADVVTWSIEAFPGTLNSADQGVVLRVEHGREHPGCASVLPPLISEGMLLDLDSAANWTSLRRVTAKKSYLFKKPGDRKASGTYLVMDDVVGVLSKDRNRLHVEYARDGRRTRGWMRMTDTAELKPP